MAEAARSGIDRERMALAVEAEAKGISGDVKGSEYS